MPLSHRRTSAYLFLLLNAALWGFSVPIIKYSLGFTSPSLFLFIRFCLAAILFLPIFLLHKSPHKQPSFKIIILALLGTPLTLLPLFIGLNQTTSFEASILDSCSPIFTIALSYFLLRDRMTRRELQGIFVTVLGAAIFALEPVFSGAPLTFTSSGNLFVLLGATVWAVFLVLAKKWHPDTISLTFYSFLVSIPFFYFLHLNSGASFIPSTFALPGILYMAIFGSIVAFWAYQEGQKRIEASEAALFTYLKPVFAIPLSLIWLRETVSPIAIIATIVIVIGVFLAESK